jgi:hypothetical protein
MERFSGDKALFRQQGFVSFWIKVDSSSFNSSVIYTSETNGGFSETAGCLAISNNSLYFFLNDQHLNQNLTYTHSFSTPLTVGIWYHVAISWYPLSGNSYNVKSWVRKKGDALSLQQTYSQNTNSSYAFYNGDFYLAINGFPGAFSNSGVSYYDFVMHNQLLELNVEGNRRKLITDGGSPVFLGKNAEKLFGSPPQVFFGGKADTWRNNKGTVGNFNIISPANFTKSPTKPA